MALYNYRCSRCNRLFACETRADATTCSYCQGQAIRKFSFSVSTGLQEHWNTAVGQYVKNERDMSEALKRQSEAMSIRTGIDHDYQYVDPADMKEAGAHGVNEDTLEPTRKIQRDLS
jgi:DNA-directed RNA polymerase subunit RPC12/RpoP